MLNATESPTTNTSAVPPGATVLRGVSAGAGGNGASAATSAVGSARCVGGLASSRVSATSSASSAMPSSVSPTPSAARLSGSNWPPGQAAIASARSITWVPVAAAAASISSFQRSILASSFSA